MFYLTGTFKGPNRIVSPEFLVHSLEHNIICKENTTKLAFSSMRLFLCLSHNLAPSTFIPQSQ